MAKTAQQIVQEIDAYMGRFSRYYSEWYVGISANPRSRLFTDHNVSESSGQWIFSESINEANARAAEKYFTDQGAKGAPGGGINPRYVYAYKIQSYTRQ